MNSSMNLFLKFSLGGGGTGNVCLWGGIIPKIMTVYTIMYQAQSVSS